jgi:hypothetical protein
MTHRRKTIRDAVVTLLDTGAIVTSGRVYSNRSLPVGESDLPVLLVYTQSETSGALDLSSKTLSRQLTIVVEAVAKDVNDATLDDTLDALAEAVETALQADSAWNGTVFDSTLIATDIDLERNGDVPLGRIRLTYQARYHF